MTDHALLATSDRRRMAAGSCILHRDAMLMVVGLRVLTTDTNFVHPTAHPCLHINFRL